jgi:hypothetical protein
MQAWPLGKFHSFFLIECIMVTYYWSWELSEIVSLAQDVKLVKTQAYQEWADS